MRKIVLSIVLSVSLLFGVSNNPKVYASLGDMLYNSRDGFNSIKDLPYFDTYKNLIATYIKQLDVTKQQGFAIEVGENNDLKGYLKKLRKLNKQYELLLMKVRIAFEEALEKNDVAMFVKLVNSGLIDINRYKKQIVDFYYMNADTITLQDGTILSTLIAQEKAKKKKRHSAAYYKRLRERAAKMRLKRLREKAKRNAKALQREAEIELQRKKEQIRQEQLRELQKDL